MSGAKFSRTRTIPCDHNNKTILVLVLLFLPFTLVTFHFKSSSMSPSLFFPITIFLHSLFLHSLLSFFSFFLFSFLYP